MKISHFNKYLVSIDYPRHKDEPEILLPIIKKKVQNSNLVTTEEKDRKA